MRRFPVPMLSTFSSLPFSPPLLGLGDLSFSIHIIPSLNPEMRCGKQARVSVTNSVGTAGSKKNTHDVPTSKGTGH